MGDEENLGDDDEGRQSAEEGGEEDRPPRTAGVFQKAGIEWAHDAHCAKNMGPKRVEPGL